MANNFQNIPDSNWSMGIDALSAETDIEAGYVEESENFDNTPENYLSKRKGYQGLYGNLPVRVVSVEYTTDPTANLCFTLDGSIDLSRVSSTPLVVEGKLSVASTGDFSDTDNSVHWYPSFTAQIEKSFASGTHTLSIPQTQHSLNTPYIWVGNTAKDSTDISNTQFYIDNISVDKSSFDITETYTNGGSDFTGFTYYIAREAEAGVTFVSVTNTYAAGSHTVSIPNGTHSLANSQILAKAFIDTGTAYVELEVDSVTIASNADVTISFVASATTDIFFVLTAAPLGNSMSGTVVSYDTIPVGPKTMSVTFDTEFPFFFLSCYLESGTDLIEVKPDSISYDDIAKQATVTFTNGGDSESFVMYWVNAAISANKLCVDATTIVTPVSDSRPQLTIWGLSHEDIYGNNADTRAGWVTHIDSYRSESQEFLVAGLGGVFYKGQSRDDVSATEWLIPQAFPNLRGRSGGTVSCGPTFIDISDATFRTRGNIKGDNLGANFARVGSYVYNSVTGYVDVTLPVTSLFVDGTLSTIVSTTPGQEDEATIRGAPFSLYNGTWPIKDISVDANNIYLSLDIPAVTLPDYDDAGGVGELGIFTDSLALQSTSPFEADDTILVDTIADNLPIKCLYSSGTTLGLKDVTEQVDFPNAIRISGSRLSDVMPVRDETGTPTVTNFVAGDMLAISGFAREFRILEVNPDDFTLTLDEVFEWADDVQNSNTIAVTGRWVPFEAPTDNFSLTPSTYPRYMSESPYDLQPFVHSSMAANSMYLTNGEDRPQKIDGVSIYRPGLPRWQSQLFVAVNTSASAKIQLNQASCATTGWANNRFDVASDDVKTFLVGTRIRRDGDDTTIYTVIDVLSDSTASPAVYGIMVDKDITGVTGADSLREVCTYSYYFRLNMVDRNNQIVASAATGSEDCVVELTEDAQLRLRLIGLPPLDNYDYDRIEVQVYRTKKNGVAPYYLLSTIPLNFDVANGYVDYIDSDSDEDLKDTDRVMTALKGAELGTAWSPPLRSKFLTSVTNSLIQGNFKSNPFLDIRFVDTGTRITPAVLNGFRFLFKKDIDDTATTTNMVDRIGAEWRDTGDKTIVDIVGGSGTFTVEVTGHGAVVGDWVYLFRKTAPTAGSSNYFAGWWQVAATADTDHMTFNWPNVPGSFTFADDVDTALFASNTLDLPVWLGTDYNFSWRRELGDDATAPYERLAVLRMASALNSAMRQTDVSITGQEIFQPWFVADAGGEFEIGQLLVSQPLNVSTGSSVVLPSSLGNYSLFVNSVLRSAEDEVGVEVQLYGSRLLASYQNFPEIIDNPTALVDDLSDSAVDVNPADGQEITAIIPFFGEAAFGAAQKNQIVIAFKQNGAYIVNFAEKRAGRQAVQKIQSENLGCTGPNAVTTVKDGVVFINRSGIYKIPISLVPNYYGRRLQRIWREDVDLDAMDTFAVTNFSSQSKVKLSYRLKGESTNARQFVYNTTKEYSSADAIVGGWTTYNNWESIGFANLNDTNYNATTFGRVFATRNTGDDTDYRDDSSAIAATVTLRAMDFGDEGRRKTIPYAVITYRNPENQGSRNVVVEYALNMANAFDEADLATIPNRGPVNDLSDTSGQKSVAYRYSFNEKKGVYFQLRISNFEKDESLDISKVTYVVAGLTSRGITQAASTSQST